MNNDEGENLGNAEEAPKATIWVTLARPGAVACGDYLAGKPYEVEAGEGKRLIEIKGFKEITAEEAKVMGDKPAA